eukprot:6485382-Amphidinium_carterae.1
MAGDVESNPGPRSDKHPRAGDLLQMDIGARTQAIYDTRLKELLHFYRPSGFAQVPDIVQGAPEQVAQRLAVFLRQQYSTGAWNRAHAAQFIAAVKRFMVISLSLGRPVPEPDLCLVPARRLLKTWAQQQPVESHIPVPQGVVQALVSLLISTGHWSAALLVALGFHCLLRVEELMGLKWQHLEPAPAVMAQAYKLVQGLVCIERPKLRTGLHRNNVQFVTVEDTTLAAFLAWLVADLVPADKAELIWPEGPVQFLVLWKWALHKLGLHDMHFVPSGLRGGGATHHYLIHQDLPRLRRRGRWQAERTLEHYLHEVVYAQQQSRMPEAAANRVADWAALTPTLLNPPPAPAPPLFLRRKALGGDG